MDSPCPPFRRRPWANRFFPRYPDLHFSLSHGKTHILAAVSEAPVGADVETVRPVRAGVPERVCTQAELSEFDFFELWVLKESYVKLTGDIRTPVSRLHFSRSGGVILPPDKTVKARLFDTIPGCRAAVCSNGGENPGADHSSQPRSAEAPLTMQFFYRTRNEYSERGIQ